jgi:hypothetical protein
MMSQPEQGVISIRTALILFAVLTAASCFALKGPALVIALLIIGALAAKAIVHYFRRRIE